MAMDTTKIRNPEMELWMNKHLNLAGRLVYLGTPILADDDRIVVSANMKNGTYTKAANPDVPRNITVTHTIVATGTDTLGTITIVGTDIEGLPVSEVITPDAGTTVAGEVIFKTVTSITGAGWVIAGGNDTIKVGVGTVIGLPFALNTLSKAVGFLGGTFLEPTIQYSSNVSTCGIDASAGTYDGSKALYVIVAE
jgi:flavin-dependent dehydrogenase